MSFSQPETDDVLNRFATSIHNINIGVREGMFFIGGGVGRGILEIFWEKSRGPPTSQNGLMHGPSQIPTQKHNFPNITFKRCHPMKGVKTISRYFLWKS